MADRVASSVATSPTGTAGIGAPATSGGIGRIDVLDGWRALSILLVLVSHWLPMPGALQANHMAGAAGMAMFFTLSGFLIARLLLRDPQPGPFLVRRIFRIVPLAWAAVLILVIANGASFEAIAANFLFYANLPPARLLPGGEHLWSLCVEVQFYLGAALLVAVFGKRGVWAFPVLALVVTGLRIADAQTVSIVTWHRVDEILAGATLALVLAQPAFQRSGQRVPPWACLLALGLLFAASHPLSGPLQYLRPYFAAAAIGCSILATPPVLARWLTTRFARYVAAVSYAVYVIHGMLTATWLGGEEASRSLRYALRPLLVAATFALAHISTFYFEARFIALGKLLANKVSLPVPVAARPSGILAKIKKPSE